MGKAKEQKKTIRVSRMTILLTLLVFIQLLTVCHWQSVKSNFYVDEYYSMEQAALLRGDPDGARYFTWSGRYEKDRWIPAAPLRARFVVTEEKSLAGSLRSALKKTLTGRNYNALLNIAMALLDPEPFGERGGLFLNLIFFVLLQVSLILFLRRLGLSEPVLFMAVASFGFSSIVISLALYIRFYLLTMLFVLWLTDLHLIMWQSRRTVVHLAGEVLTFLLMYLSFRNSELSLIVSGMLAVTFSGILIADRRWHQTALYALPLFGGGFLYLAKRAPRFLTLLFDIESAAEFDGSQGFVARKILGESFADKMSYLVRAIPSWISRELFGSRVIFLLMLLAVVTALILVKRRGWSPGRDGNGRFIAALAISAFVYTAFMVISTLGSVDFSERYYAFCLLFIFIIFWYAVDRISKAAKDDRSFQVKILIMFALLTAAGVARKQMLGDFHVLYRNDVPALEAADQAGLDSILIVNNDDHAVYEALSRTTDDSMLYVIEEGSVPEPSALSGRFVLWGAKEHDYEKLLDTLNDEGYQTEKLGETHISAIWLCTREAGAS